MGDPRELQRAIDHLCRQDFGAFTVRASRIVNGCELEPNWHIDAIAYKLTQVERGDVKRLILCMPPRYLKTYLVSICFTAWILGRNPQAKIICASYAAPLAEKFSSDTLLLMQSSWYRRIFPATVLNPKKQGREEFATTAGGYRLATSVGGTITGRGADLIIIDDPLKASEAHSPTARQSSITWYNSTIQSRLNKPMEGRIIVVSQRLHAEDLPGSLLEAGGWDDLIIPAIADKDRYYNLLDGAPSARCKGGRVLQPGRHDRASLDQLRKEMGERDFEAQYNQRPLPPGGATFKAAWLERYDAAPSPAMVQGVFQSWDTAYEGGATNDYSVCTTWAVRGDQTYLLDVWRDRPQFWELEKKLVELRQNWGASLVIVEKAGSGISLLQNLRDGRGCEWLQSVSPASPKISRAEQQTHKFEQRRIHLPRDAPWLAAYENELLAFPHGKHDDQVDSTVQFLGAWDSGKLLKYADVFGRG